MAVENDIVLIYHEEKPLSFARIEEIMPDHKPDWYHVRLLILQLPLHTVTWILRDGYINGETYTMGGKSMRLELVEAPESGEALEETARQKTAEAISELSPPSTKSGVIEPKKPTQENAKVISLADLKKNNGK